LIVVSLASFSMFTKPKRFDFVFDAILDKREGSNW